MSLASVIRYWAQWSPTATSVIDAGARITWAELDARTDALAGGLGALGVGTADRVGILSENRVEFLELAIACHKRGAILVPLNQRLAVAEIAAIVAHAGCSAVAASAGFADRCAAALEAASTPSLGIGLDDDFDVSLGDLRRERPTELLLDADPNGVAYICYTSGTTGTPKGVALTHANVLAMSHARIVADQMTSRSRSYLPFPLSFTGGLVTVWGPIYTCGGTIVLDSVVDPQRILAAIEAHGITTFSAVPVIWEMIATHENLTRSDLSTLKVAAVGGATVPESLLRRLRAAGVPLRQSYALTEGSGFNTWMPDDAVDRKPGSCGLPLMHSRVRTVAPDRRDALADVAPGEVGELAISGPQVMLGYWGDPRSTAAALTDGWLRTGDLARIDTDGFVHVVDRAKDMLISGGLNVYPAEIEAVLAEFDTIAECAVIGVPDGKWGERPVAFVHPVPGATVDERTIANRCRERLADYKQPREIIIRDQPLPRGMSGKVLKDILRTEYAEPR